ncbi:hypothetical protein AAIA72_14490 [Hahella sp. SMD15-11]|uniref:EamA family transporter n=1 Tax=Thermohahella caldifontis TaxID=3142973 RepID=A0AB39UVJ9_9GAMM
MPWRMVMLTTLAMLAFAGNSLLARAALKMTVLDPASFTTLRLASGALASGLGYALWYAVLPAMRPFQAASVQLTVPVLAALGGFCS